MSKFNLNSIQQALSEYNMDGWLFYDFHGNDPLGKAVLKMSLQSIQSRRWYYYIPAIGVPQKLVHSIEQGVLDHLPGNKEIYSGWKEMQAKLKTMFKGGEKVAMQYSPKNAVPYISRVDAGTIELLKSYKIKPVTSADLVQLFEARWSKSQLNTHINAAKHLSEIVAATFKMIRDKMNARNVLNEFQVQQFMCEQMSKRGLFWDHDPIVGIGPNSGNPHYYPTADTHSPLTKENVLQLDIWAKDKSDEDAVYADISWVGYLGESVPQKFADVFAIVREARDSAVEFVDNAIKNNQTIGGWQVDDVSRGVIEKAGYGQYFVHRTGHSIGREVHANGVNIDNLETKDERSIIPGTCFSIEPGIYMKEFGMRTEIDVYVDEKGAQVHTQPMQKEVVAIFK